MKLTGNKIFPLARWYTTVVLMAFEERTVDCNNNLYFKRMTPITIKSILPSGPLKTKLIIINNNSRDKKPIYK